MLIVTAVYCNVWGFDACDHYCRKFAVL